MRGACGRGTSGNMMRGAQEGPGPDGVNLVGDGAQKLRILFNRVSALPRLNDAAVKLLRLLENDNASVHQLELIISSDPALATKVLRTASMLLDIPFQRRHLSIASAIMLLGIRNTRSVALSLAINSTLLTSRRTPFFEPKRFVRHNLFVAFSAANVYRRIQLDRFPDAKWSPDEIFAAGLLYNLGIPIHYHVHQELYNFLALQARDESATFTDMFRRMYGETLGDLAAETANLWELPPLFGKVMRDVELNIELDEASLPAACVRYGRFLAHESSFFELPWEARDQNADEIVKTIAFDADLVPTVRELAERQVSSYARIAA